MSDWRIAIPYRDRDDSIVDLVDNAAQLPDEDQAVCRQVALSALEDGVTRAGELIDRLEAMGPDQRRVVLDRAREAAGCESASAIEAEERFRANCRMARARALDLESRPHEKQPRLVVGAGGGLREIDPVEIERQERQEAKAAAAFEERRREKEREAAERAAADRAAEERAALELPPGYRA